MNHDNSNGGRARLYAGAAIGLVLAAAGGFAVARLTGPATPASATEAEAEAPANPGGEIAIDANGIKASGIQIAPATAGTASAIVLASATVEASPDAEAVLTARAAGTVTRIFRRIGDPVRQGETIALVESRDASAIAADRSAAAARVTLARRQLERERLLFKQGVSPRADLETAEANLGVAEADLRRASTAGSTARVTSDGRSVAVVSPISGRITAAPASLGTFVNAETELFRLADPARLQVTASLPPADAVRVRAGDKVELTANDGTRVDATVRSATGVVDPRTRQATIVIAPGSGSSLIVPGQLVQARVFTRIEGAPSSAVTVPQDAVQTIGARTVVFVRTPRGFRARTVQVGTRSAGMAEIVSGLAAGMPVATANAFLLKAELEKNAGGEE